MASFQIRVLILHLLMICITCNSTQNRLIQSFKTNTNSSLLHETLEARRRLYIVQNFKKDNARLEAVALISKKDSNGGWKGCCTGSYIKPPAGDNGKYVLTAAHCFWDRTKGGTRKWSGNDVKEYKVEFRVIDDPQDPEKKNANKIIKCDVSDIRVPNKYMIELHEYRYDYAVMKLTGTDCNPTSPFIISNYRNSPKFMTQTFRRAGYSDQFGGDGQGASSRRLTVHVFERVKDSELKREHPERYEGVLICDGQAGKSDSGSPLYDERTGHLKAVYSGTNGLSDKDRLRFNRAVEINKVVHTDINKFMRREAGVSLLIISCGGYFGTANDNDECWQSGSKCSDAEQQPHGTCHRDAKGLRKFADPVRKMECGNNKFIYLCAPVTRSSDARSGFVNFIKEYHDGSLFYDDEIEDYYYDEGEN